MIKIGKTHVETILWTKPHLFIWKGIAKNGELKKKKNQDLSNVFFLHNKILSAACSGHQEI